MSLSERYFVGPTLVDGDVQIVCGITEVARVHGPNATQRAQLMAAAHGLLAGCEAALCWLAQNRPAPGNKDLDAQHRLKVWKDVQDKLLAEIARARGE